MFNRNEWLQWAKNNQNSNPMMQNFGSGYWKKNNPLYIYEEESYGRPDLSSSGSGPPERSGPPKPGSWHSSSSSTYSPPRVREGPGGQSSGRSSGISSGSSSTRSGKSDRSKIKTKLKNVATWVKQDPHLTQAGRQAASWYAVDRGLDKLTSFLPSRRKAKEKEERISPTRIGVEHPQTESVNKAASAAAGTVEGSKQIDEVAVLDELSAKGWKNVATGAKVADAASTALTIGSLIAAPFTGGLSLAGLGAAAAIKGATKVGTTVAAKGATKMASKMASKQASKLAVQKAAQSTGQSTLKQKALGAGKQLGKNVATGAAMQGGMSAVTPKPKSPTTAVSTRPPMPAPSTNINYKKNIPVVPPPTNRRLAASYDPELVERISSIFRLRRTPKINPKIRTGPTSLQSRMATDGSRLNTGSRLSRVGELAKKAKTGTIQYAKKLPREVGKSIPMALAFSAPSLLQKKPQDPRPTVSGQDAPPPRLY